MTRLLVIDDAFGVLEVAPHLVRCVTVPLDGVSADGCSVRVRLVPTRAGSLTAMTDSSDRRAKHAGVDLLCRVIPSDDAAADSASEHQVQLAAVTSSSRADWRVPHDCALHAAGRWATAAATVLEESRDPRTLADWARCASAAPGTLRNWCRTARIPAKKSLDFARVLRAMLWQRRRGGCPQDLLDVVDGRTLAGLLRLGATTGPQPTNLPQSIEDFLARQCWVQSASAISAVGPLFADRWDRAEDCGTR